jgi:DNA end-binding protein Ku
MKPVWTGAIGFGLVNIPVRLFSATQSSTIDLDMLDKKDHSNIRYKRVNEKTGKEVPWNNIVKGFRTNEKYVVLDEKDFKAASPEKSSVLAIEHFVEESAIDSMYFEMPYYLQAAKGGERAYFLLKMALEKTGKAGIATFVMRNREHLAIIRPLENLLILQLIRFAEEIREPEELHITGQKKISANELKMATTLVNQLTEKFDIRKYKDTYSAALMKLIKAKAKGQKTKSVPLRVAYKRSDDLMSQLKESLQTKKRKTS